MRFVHMGRAFARALALAVLAAAVVAPASASADGITCQDRYFPVTLLALPETMYGHLCVPAGATTIEVLVPGATYNSSYWDIGYESAERSFRLAMNNAGIATLTLDRLGTGNSSKPLSALLTSTAQADAVHEVIQRLRAGAAGTTFSKVIVGGHSEGSAIATIEANAFRDVDGLLVTGLGHHLNATSSLGQLTSLVPALLDPQLASRGLDIGYLTTQAGTRFQDFQAPGAYDAGAAAYDESTKDVIAPGEVVDTIAFNSVVIPASDGITVPVLTVIGDDPDFCGLPLGGDCTSADAFRRSEVPFFPLARSLEGFVLHGIGHSLNYSADPGPYFQTVEAWADAL